MGQNAQTRRESCERQQRARKLAREESARKKVEQDQLVCSLLRLPTKTEIRRHREVQSAIGTVAGGLEPRVAARFKALVKQVFTLAPQLAESRYIRGLHSVLRVEKFWLDAPKNWKPRGHSPEKLFRSLVNHLLAKYPVPRFLYSTLFREPGTNVTNDMSLFVHIAQGGGLKGAIRGGLLPLPFTARMWHLFLQTSSSALSVFGAAREAQVLAFGGSRRLARAIRGTDLRWVLGFEMADGEALRETDIRWFCQHPMLDPAQVRPLIDYISWRRRQDRNFSMKGRSVLAMIRAMAEWHRQLAKATKLHGGSYEASGLKALELDRSGLDNDGKRIVEIWRTVEILSPEMLWEEGRAMHHCVYSYAFRIERGEVSIWSLTAEDTTGDWRRLTLEVHNRSRQIVQARGLCNRMPTPAELAVVRYWALQAGLNVLGI